MDNTWGAGVVGRGFVGTQESVTRRQYYSNNSSDDTLHYYYMSKPMYEQ